MAFAIDRRAYNGPPKIRRGTMPAFIEHQKISIVDYRHWCWDETQVPRLRKRKKLTARELAIEALKDEIASGY